MTRKVLMGMALACVAGVLPATVYADHGDRRDNRWEDRRWDNGRWNRGRHHDDHGRADLRFDIGSIIGGPACGARPVQVWVPPVYQTVTERVWVPEVTQTVVDRVYVPDHFEWRDVATGNRHCPTVRQPVLIPGHYEDRPRTVVVTPGHYEDRQTQQLVCAGHYETRYQEALRPQFSFNLQFRK